jgi:hypothetical protein
MHRELLAWGWHGKPGLCGPYFLPAMDKTAYKTQLTYPVANTAKDGGRCCQPFGRSTDRLGRRQGVPGARRGLRLHAVQEAELLCGLLTRLARWRRAAGCWQQRGCAAVRCCARSEPCFPR